MFRARSGPRTALSSAFGCRCSIMVKQRRVIVAVSVGVITITAGIVGAVLLPSSPHHAGAPSLVVAQSVSARRPDGDLTTRAMGSQASTAALASSSASGAGPATAASPGPTSATGPLTTTAPTGLHPPTSVSTLRGPTYAVPTSIPSDCSVDVTAALNSWIASVPNGRLGAPGTLTLVPNGCYDIGSADLTVDSRDNLTFNGEGATLHVASAIDAPSWYFGNDTDMAVENLHIVGTNIVSGIAADDPPALAAITYQAAEFGSSCADATSASPNCFQSGIEFDHDTGVTVNNVTTDATWGDGLTLGGEHDSSDLSTNISIDNVSIDRNGRQGIAVGTVNGVLIDNVRILHSWASAIDLEVNAPDGTINNVDVENSYFNARDASITPNGVAGVDDLSVHNNEFKFFDPSTSWLVGNPDEQGANWRIDDNVVDIAMGETPGITISNVKGIQIAGNVVPEAAPPAARQGETLPGVSFQNDSGPISVTGNTFIGDTEAYEADSATEAATTILACGNQFMANIAPVAC